MRERRQIAGDQNEPGDDRVHIGILAKTIPERQDIDGMAVTQRL